MNVQANELTIRRLLVLAAIVLFVLRAFGVADNETVDLGWLGLGVLGASFLV